MANNKLAAAMREVHKNIPSTVRRAKVSKARKRKMLIAIAFAKARKAGAKLPKKGRWVAIHKGKKV